MRTLTKREKIQNSQREKKETVSEVKNALEEINSRAEDAEESFRDLEDRVM